MQYDLVTPIHSGGRDQFQNTVTAVSKQPEEDISKPSFTLFEPIKVADKDGVFYSLHVQSGRRL